MADKVQQGQRVGKPSANLHNTSMDVADHWNRKGPWKDAPAVHTPRNYCKVKARNNTGGNLRRGEVVEFASFLLTDIEQDYLWFGGSIPDETKVGWGITLKPVPSTEIDEVLCLGVCIAWVNITNEDHKYAKRVAGEKVLQSAAVGPVKILHKPTGGTPPEERECVVQLMDEGGDYVDVMRVVSQDGSLAAGQLCFANSAGLHRGSVKRYNVNTDSFDDKGDCWIRFVDDHDHLVGDVPAIFGEWYGPGRYSGLETFGGYTWPLYTLRRGELPTEIVQVYHPGSPAADPGKVVEGLAAGYHPGNVVRYNGTSSLYSQFPCWIQFVHEFNGLAIQAQYYGPARYAGVWDKVENEGLETETHDKRPVYICELSERSFPGKFDAAIASGSSGTFSIYHPTTLTDSGINKTVKIHGDAVEADKEGFIQLVGTVWFGAQSGC